MTARTRISRKRRTRSTVKVARQFTTPQVREVPRMTRAVMTWEREVYAADPAQVGDARYL